MLNGLSAADTRLVGRGIMVLCLAIAVGVAAVDSQLNRLTARYDFGQALNIRREASGYYRAYVLGQSWGMRAVYQVGRVVHEGGALTVEAAGRKLTVPTAARLELDRAAYWLGLWRSQFTAAARDTKRELTVYWEGLRPYIRGLIDAVKQ